MSLNKNLVLFQYILRQFGYDDFEKLRDEFSGKHAGYDSTGRSYFANALLGAQKSVDDRTLLRYDEAIREYEVRLRAHRAEPFLSFKYFQFFTLLFTEYYFDRFNANAKEFLEALNAFKNRHDSFEKIDDYTESDLKKLAYWMATGSGKTLVMHCNYWQITKYFKDWENIILITPNEGLSRQHYEELKASGIEARMYSGSEESLKTREGEVLIIEITKLVKEKEGEGISVDVDYFAESRNLVFIDEGHKGQRSEEKAWKKLRGYITRGEGSFTFEYSATFGQIITGVSGDLLNEYGKAIIFDYSYRHFYADGFGKDFTVFNVDANDYSADQTRLLLTAGLLGFFEQLTLFEKFRNELRPYNIEKPLWVFVGSKVIGNGSSSFTRTDRQNISDVTMVVRFFQDILADPSALQEDIDKILENRANLVNADGDDIFKKRFEYLRKNRPDASIILSKVFHGAGQMNALQIKQGDGEIGLRTLMGEQYFAVINIGDVAKYVKKLEEDLDGSIPIQDDNFTRSLFQDISASTSTVNILIGSKKFIEGWNSWRVSSMGLMNMGKSEGPQIIQLFGRGVRLKGKELSLKREGAAASYHIRALQTISIFGLNASYMSNFLTHIEKETPEYKEYEIDLLYNNQDAWNNKVLTFKKSDEYNFRDYPIALEVKENVLKRVVVDLRAKVNVAMSGFNNQMAEDQDDYSVNFLKEYYGFIDFNALLLECNRYKLVRGFGNMMIFKKVLEKIISSGRYEVLSSSGQFGQREAVNGKMQEVAGYVVKDYLTKFYSDKEKDYLTKNLSLEMLTGNHAVFPAGQKMVVRAPKGQAGVIEALLKDVEKFYRQDVADIPTLHFDNHLYSPIAVWKRGKKYQEIKTVPVKLNEGETRFLEHLRQYLKSVADKLKGKEIYVLRNLSQRGVGFFIESSSFYPDFILWVIERKKQNIFFLDPKGIRMLGNFKDDKIVFCSETIQEINGAIQEKIEKEKLKMTVRLDAFILSVSKFSDIEASWGTRNATKEDFKDNHVLFVEDDKAYLNELFGDILENS
ncbi:MAG: DEAD/DEAH box helicase family protein [Deltaproteobacteria bacterium]|nr:DEAD/DEAH box helicase family protein [Deltaproteobacteria bacterium]